MAFPRPKPEHKPVKPLLFGDAIATMLKHTREEDNDPHAGIGAKVFNSWAGWCSRKIAYEVQGHEPEPFNPPTLWNFWVGHEAHTLVQGAIRARYPDAEIERLTISDERAGHMDFGVRLKEHGKIATELKTIGGFGFKQAISKGPNLEHKLQAFLNALDYDADLAVVAYLSKEALAPWYADGCFGDDHDPIRRIWAEWQFTRDEYEEEAKREHQRLIRLAQRPEDAPRWAPALPSNARIVDPTTGKWVVQEKGKKVDAGKYWMCDYCGHRPQCVKDLFQ